MNEIYNPHSHLTSHWFKCLISCRTRIYKNRIRTEFEKTFNTSTQEETEKPSHVNQVQEAQNKLDEELEEMNKIEKGIGDEIALATTKLRINSVKEEDMIQGNDNVPKVAEQGTKFIIISMTITNTTKAQFTFETRDLLVIDDKNIKYTPYGETIGNIDDYLDYQTLSQTSQKQVY